MLSLKRSASPVGLPALTDSTAEAFHSTELRRSKRLRLTAQPDSEHKLSTISATTKVVRKRARKIKADASELADTTPTIDANQSPLKVEKGAASPRKQTSVAKALATPHPTPERWRETYDTIKDMRSRIVAPVDTMGCDRPQLEETTPQVSSALLLWHTGNLCVMLRRTSALPPSSRSCYLLRQRMR